MGSVALYSEQSSDKMSIFEDVPLIAPDPIFQLTIKYNNDDFPTKINLGQGTYRDENGRPWILPAVRAAKETLQDSNHEYLPILGHPEFRQLAPSLILGKKSPAVVQRRVAVCQALSGTGALHLAGSFLRRFNRCPVYVTNPTWGNHSRIFTALGFDVRSFEYFSSKTHRLDFESLLEALDAAPPGSIFVLHACAHNPTGSDPTQEQWNSIASKMKERSLFPLFDAAYLGLVSGRFETDVLPIRMFADEHGMELGICCSFAKNMGLYGERCGALLYVSNAPSAVPKIESQMEQLQRSEISNPPAYGARIAAAIMGNEKLSELWQQDLVVMSTRIADMRKLLHAELLRLEVPGSWSHVTEQVGMFCILGLTLEQVTALQRNYHIFMADSSRISIAGITRKNVAYLAESINAVVRDQGLTHLHQSHAHVS